MGRLGFVDRDDLVQWGRAQGASADLPDLVRQADPRDDAGRRRSGLCDLAELRRKELASWTCLATLNLASGIFRRALTRGYISTNPVERLSKSERPSAKNKTEARVLTAEEVGSLIEHASPTYEAILATAAFTGLRQSELLGLIWSDIDFDAGTINVTAQLSRATRKRLLAGCR